MRPTVGVRFVWVVRLVARHERGVRHPAPTARRSRRTAMRRRAFTVVYRRRPPPRPPERTRRRLAARHRGAAPAWHRRMYCGDVAVVEFIDTRLAETRGTHRERPELRAATLAVPRQPQPSGGTNWTRDAPARRRPVVLVDRGSADSRNSPQTARRRRDLGIAPTCPAGVEERAPGRGLADPEEGVRPTGPRRARSRTARRRSRRRDDYRHEEAAPLPRRAARRAVARRSRPNAAAAPTRHPPPARPGPLAARQVDGSSQTTIATTALDGVAFARSRVFPRLLECEGERRARRAVGRGAQCCLARDRLPDQLTSRAPLHAHRDSCFSAPCTSPKGAGPQPRRLVCRKAVGWRIEGGAAPSGPRRYPRSRSRIIVRR